MIAELAEVNALPCAQIKMVARDRDVDADAADGALGVCWHVIGSFEGVHIIRGVLGNQPIEYVGKVGSYIRIGILVDGQGTTGMLHKEIQHSRLREFWQLSADFCGHKVTSPAFG